MLAKTQIKFSGILGTNSNINADELRKIVAEMECAFNDKYIGICRLHIEDQTEINEN